MTRTSGWSIAVLAAACLAAAPSIASAQPVILPSPTFKAGGKGWLEVVAPAGTRSCRLTLHGGGRSYGPYRVSLGGPTRLVRWRIPKGARGSARAAFACKAGGRQAKWRQARSRSFAVGRPGRTRGRLVARRSVRAGRGSIPEMPAPTASAAAETSSDSNGDVDTTIGNGDPSKFTACQGSTWVTSTRTIGDGVGTYVQVDPTGTARLSTLNSGLENDPTYLAIWEDVKRCTGLGRGMTGSQRHSLYMQLACHARYGVSSRFGGDTWDLEAWRNDVPWDEGLSLGGKCGQSYGNVDGAGSYLRGRIVNQFPLDNPAQPTAWLVEPLRPGTIDVRQRIQTANAYGCLLRAGKDKASWFPAHFLDFYLPIVTREIGDDICGSPAPPDTTPPPGDPGSTPPADTKPTPPQTPQPPQAPQPPPTTWAEQQGSLGANTFTNPYNASGMGVKIQPYQWVQVSCKVYAPQIASANPDGYWYRIASAPWNNAYYAVANTFWNGDVPGQRPYTHNTDWAVPNC